MRKRTALVGLVVSLNLSACQTINGVDLTAYDTLRPVIEAQDESFCARNPVVCIVGLVVGVSGAILLVSSKAEDGGSFFGGGAFGGSY